MIFKGTIKSTMSIYKGQIIAEGNNSIISLLPDGVIVKEIWDKEKRGNPSLFEVELCLNSHHPHLIKAKSVMFSPDKTILFFDRAVYDLLEGVNAGLVNKKDTIRFLYQTSLALEGLHNANIAHLDVKPENILIFNQDGKLNAKLADLGYARYVSNPTIPTPAKGTPLYFSPELLEAAIKGHKTPLLQSTDIWSLGISFYFLLSGTDNYDLNEEGVELTFNELLDKTKRLWLISDQDKYDRINSKIKDSKISYLLSKMITIRAERLVISQVVDYLSEIVDQKEDRLPLKIKEAMPLPEKVREEGQAITGYFRLIEPWVSRLYGQDFPINVIVYICLSYIGLQPSVLSYLTDLPNFITTTTFKNTENKTLKRLYTHKGELQQSRQKPKSLPEKVEDISELDDVEKLTEGSSNLLMLKVLPSDN